MNAALRGQRASEIVASNETFVPNEPDEKPGGEDEESAEDRPTVAPPFDPVEFAKGVLGGRPSPARGMAAAMKTPPGPQSEGMFTRRSILATCMKLAKGFQRTMLKL